MSAAANREAALLSEALKNPLAYHRWRAAAPYLVAIAVAVVAAVVARAPLVPSPPAGVGWACGPAGACQQTDGLAAGTSFDDCFLRCAPPGVAFYGCTGSKRTATGAVVFDGGCGRVDRRTAHASPYDCAAECAAPQAFACEPGVGVVLSDTGSHFGEAGFDALSATCVLRHSCQGGACVAGVTDDPAWALGGCDGAPCGPSPLAFAFDANVARCVGADGGPFSSLADCLGASCPYGSCAGGGTGMCMGPCDACDAATGVAASKCGGCEECVGGACQASACTRLDFKFCDGGACQPLTCADLCGAGAVGAMTYAGEGACVDPTNNGCGLHCAKDASGACVSPCVPCAGAECVTCVSAAS